MIHATGSFRRGGPPVSAATVVVVAAAAVAVLAAATAAAAITLRRRRATRATTVQPAANAVPEASFPPDWRSENDVPAPNGRECRGYVTPLPADVGPDDPSRPPLI